MHTHRWIRLASVALTLAASVTAGIAGATSGAAATKSAPASYRVVEGTTLRPAPPSSVLPVASYDLTGEFGDVSYYWSSAHTGLDFATGSGTPIRSVSDGVVTSAGWDGSYGYKTVVRLEGGTVLWYCHQDSVAVRVGERLAAGDVLGFVGSSGNVTGAHLHLEVRRDGQLVDPYAVLVERGLRP